MSTVYPEAIDSDNELTRVDDNITDLGGQAIDELRSAVFAIEETLGINPQGSSTNVASRLDQSLNSNGTIKADALSSVGLATLPITDSQVGNNAGIKESKLDLDYPTSDLHTVGEANSMDIASLQNFTNQINSDLNTHITGGQTLQDGDPARHVLSHIDINGVPNDSRDPAFVWTGLKDKDGNARTATQAAEALFQINQSLIDHENKTTDAHPATAITVDTSNFNEIPLDVKNAQQVFDYLDDAETLNLGQHRATQHANAIPKIARTAHLDGALENIVPSTFVQTFLVTFPNTVPVDDLSIGDDLVQFVPDNTDFIFDSQFSQVKIGDVITINYGNGIEAIYTIDSLRYTPGSEWIVRLNGVNLFGTADGYDGYDGYATATIDRPSFDVNISGVLAVAAANPTPTGLFSNILASVIVGHPRGATALGLGFDPGKLDEDHYKLYLQLYPTGNPADKIINLPAIDVTGDAGISPGFYTLEKVILATNNNLRQAGFNYRFIAFAYQGEFGIMLADPIGGASFSIVNGDNSSGTLVTGSFTDNVIGGNSIDDFDALGLGPAQANIASPVWQNTFFDSTAAALPTKVIMPFKQRFYHVNGEKRDTFAPTYLAIGDGYWPANISARTPIGSFTVETTYHVELDLSAAELKSGKTIVVQPTIEFDDTLYNDVDYGRFIIKNVNFIAACGSIPASTEITVINGIHGTGVSVGSSAIPDLAVKLYFSEDSVAFNIENIIDPSPAVSDYSRLHEIYIDDDRKTFSHERGRMPRQTEDFVVSALGTNRWHILDISPKLRGYRDSSALFNKYVRLYITRYDFISGEFDGYLGRRDPFSTSVSLIGPTSTGRKNVPVRFYDETGIDFIEMQFEDGASPGVAILSTNSPRYVDIELFSSLRLDDELLLLATCEVNWDPIAGKDVVQHVRDARQFGSVDENDFTNSAIDFISAGEKYLHENGIIRGLAFETISGSDNRQVFFKGGLALVNGHILAVNNCSIGIPQIYPNGSSLPQDVTWAVCVNESAELSAIVITNSKTQFFATPGSGNYYIPSVTFSELINTRKDLTPIALVTAHIASFTISPDDVKDVRRFIVSEGQNHPLVWANDQFIGNFTTLEAVKNWIENYIGGSRVVRLRGNFTVDEAIDFTDFSQPIILEGDGAIFNISSGKGLILGNNITLRNIRFNYNPIGLTYSTNTNGTFPDLINTGNGCIYFFTDRNETLENITIENCEFASFLEGSQRPPFINGEISAPSVAKNILIQNNKYNDFGGGTDQAAIAIICLNDPGSDFGGVIRDTKIIGNQCLNNQGIYVTAKPFGGAMTVPGFNSINTSIEKNNCAIIGFNVSGVPNLLFSEDKTHGLNISNNVCHYIASVDATGLSNLILNTVNYATGQVNIENNACHWIHVQVRDTTTSNPSFFNIEKNSLTGYDYNFIKYKYVDGYDVDQIYGVALNVAIIMYTVQSVSTGTSVHNIIRNHIIEGVFQETGFPYDYGIFSNYSSNISENVIKTAINSGGTGIFAFSNGNSTPVFIIQKNRIFRGSTSLVSYIEGVSFRTAPINYPAIVTDNIFDFPTVDGADLSVVRNVPASWLVERNINQTVIVQFKGYYGTVVVENVTAGTPATATSFAQVFNTPAPPLSTVRFFYSDAISEVILNWFVPLFGNVPNNVKIISVNVDVIVTVNPDTTSIASLYLINNSITYGGSGAAQIDPLNTSGGTLTVTPGSDFHVTPSNSGHVQLKYKVAHSSSTIFSSDVIYITYRW